MTHGTIEESSDVCAEPPRNALIRAAPDSRAARAGARRSRSGDAEAEFDAFFRQYYREFGRLAYSMTGTQADADDVVGEGLAAAWEHWDRVQEADYPRAYVRRIIVNLAANRVNALVRQRQTVTLIGPILRWFYHGPDVGASVDLQAAILALSPGRRACIVLRHVLDLPEEEVAHTLGITLGTVKSQTSKGLAQLRVALAEVADVTAGRGVEADAGGPARVGADPQPSSRSVAGRCHGRQPSPS